MLLLINLREKRESTFNSISGALLALSSSFFFDGEHFLCSKRGQVVVTQEHCLVLYFFNSNLMLVC